MPSPGDRLNSFLDSISDRGRYRRRLARLREGSGTQRPEELLRSLVWIERPRLEALHQSVRLVLQQHRGSLAQPEGHHALDLLHDAAAPLLAERATGFLVLAVPFDGVPQVVGAFAVHRGGLDDRRSPL